MLLLPTCFLSFSGEYYQARCLAVQGPFFIHNLKRGSRSPRGSVPSQFTMHLPLAPHPLILGSFLILVLQPTVHVLLVDLSPPPPPSPSLHASCLQVTAPHVCVSSTLSSELLTSLIPPQLEVPGVIFNMELKFCRASAEPPRGFPLSSALWPSICSLLFVCPPAFFCTAAGPHSTCCCLSDVHCIAVPALHVALL